MKALQPHLVMQIRFVQSHSLGNQVLKAFIKSQKLPQPLAFPALPSPGAWMLPRQEPLRYFTIPLINLYKICWQL